MKNNEISVNATQLLIVADHIGTRDDVMRALRYCLIDGMTRYAAEKKAGIAHNSLRKKINRVLAEIEYIKSFNKAGTAEFQHSLDI